MVGFYHLLVLFKARMHVGQVRLHCGSSEVTREPGFGTGLGWVAVLINESWSGYGPVGLGLSTH